MTAYDPFLDASALDVDSGIQDWGSEMQKKASGFAVGTFLIVTAFVWLVFHNLALGIVFGLIAGGTSGAIAKDNLESDQRPPQH